MLKFVLSKLLWTNSNPTYEPFEIAIIKRYIRIIYLVFFCCCLFALFCFVLVMCITKIIIKMIWRKFKAIWTLQNECCDGLNFSLLSIWFCLISEVSRSSARSSHQCIQPPLPLVPIEFIFLEDSVLRLLPAFLVRVLAPLAVVFALVHLFEVPLLDQHPNCLLVFEWQCFDGAAVDWAHHCPYSHSPMLDSSRIMIRVTP